MNQEKKCKVIPLATKDSSTILKNREEGTWRYYPDSIISHLIDSYQHFDTYHLYILSDDEIKIGDLILYNHPVANSGIPSIHRVINLHYSKDKAYEVHFDTGYGNKDYCKKIIATTDTSLNLPRPSDNFIKKYCEAGGIDKVMVEYETIRDYDMIMGTISKSYPKVAPDNTITIRKVKDSWSKEEVKELMKSAFALGSRQAHLGHGYTPDESVERILRDQ